jgi:tetratricopeptide (TPR) repeat protein
MYFDADEISDLIDFFDEAEDVEHYEKVLALGQRLHPDNADIKLRSCRSLIYNEHFEEALNLINQLDIDGENHLELTLMRLECFCYTERTEEVAAYVEKQRATQPPYLENIYEYLAPIVNGLKSDGVSGYACTFIRQGATLFPRNMTIKEELCYLLEMEDNCEGAVAVCKELLDHDPYSIDYWYMQGRLYLSLNEFEKAIDSFDFALTCDDSEGEIKLLKAYSLYKLESYEKAINIYRDLIDDPEDDTYDSSALPLMAECYMHLGEYEIARDIYTELVCNWETPVTGGIPVYQNYLLCCFAAVRERLVSNPQAGHSEEYLLEPIRVIFQTIARLLFQDPQAAIGVVCQALDALYKIYANTQVQVLQTDAVTNEDIPYQISPDTQELLDRIREGVDPALYPVHDAISYLFRLEVTKFCEIYAELDRELVALYVGFLFGSIVIGARRMQETLDTHFLQLSDIHAFHGESPAPEELVSSFMANSANLN